MPELRLLNVEIMHGMRTSRRILSDDVDAWQVAAHQSSLLRLSGFIDISPRDLIFKGDLKVYGFLAMAVNARGGDPHPPSIYPYRVSLGVRRYELYVPSVCYRVTRSQDPAAWLGVDMEIVGRAGWDDEFLAERDTGILCAITAADYEAEMQRGPEQQSIAASYGDYYLL
ncbi:hypothetical protein B0A48_14369 [Cryoendolithus antarcticus]|uniref:Uncharacterized protein n=1 Tax=Cryoendolithus antarcticus TaxID=1507870 RepID=A0A1V8SJS0_9PEZI|nr:hypothetical protein B0A48_14369 [Cryoendolithus antarcticus]